MTDRSPQYWRAIHDAAKKKIEATEAKIAEREGRIARIRKEFDITDAELVSLFAQAANEANNRYANSMSYNLQSSTGESLHT